MNIGDSIKYYRKLKNLTQKDLAEKLNLSTSLIQKYENGERKLKIDTLKQIIDVLDTPLSVFLNETDDCPIDNFNITDIINTETYDNLQKINIDNYDILKLVLYSKPSDIKELEKLLTERSKNTKDKLLYLTLLKNPIIENRFNYNYENLTPPVLVEICNFIDQMLEIKINDIKFRNNLNKQK